MSRDDLKESIKEKLSLLNMGLDRRLSTFEQIATHLPIRNIGISWEAYIPKQSILKRRLATNSDYSLAQDGVTENI